MPSWEENVRVENLTQDILSGLTQLAPGETAHVQIKRTGLVTDLILVQVFGTLEDDPNERDQVPLFAFGLRTTETSLSFIMRGVWGFYVLLLNGKNVPTGSITGDFRSKKDGVDIG